MWEGSYGREPFDLRLTALRLLRSMGGILAVTLIGSLLFGGVYYVKNVLLAEKLFSATITCKIEYTDPPTKSGDYYINAATWNTYVASGEFLDMVMAEEPLVLMDSFPVYSGQLRDCISADVASDIQVPSFIITSDNEKHAEVIEQAVANALTGPWAEQLPEVSAIKVIDMGEVGPVTDEFVRPVRAFVFGAVLTCFFAVILFLLREIGADSIWLPATVRTRYGLTSLGTLESGELEENIRYAFEKKDGPLHKNALCAADERIDPKEALRVLREKKLLGEGQDWTPMPLPTLCPETAQLLRQMDGILLAVPAGLHVGKPLEHILEFFREQDIKITAVILWNADEKLIRSYYRLQR